MSEYVKQGFTPEQLGVLCDCMQEGITDFSIIANKDYPPEVMKICEYIIMPNHLHFIISKTGDHAGSPLRRFVPILRERSINGRPHRVAPTV